VITKGPPLTNFVLKPLQNFLWNGLRKWEVFSLIGETVTRELIEKRLRQLRDDEVFISGDYKSATNELLSFVSDAIADEIAIVCGLDAETATLLKRALTHHYLVNPADDQDWREQKNGQLMGSIISFPILCIANFALCRWALEFGRGRTLRPQDLPLLVNGDDCVFRTNEVGKKAWRKLCKNFGLAESVGKTYFSRTFLQINSTLYRVKPKEEGKEELRIEQVLYPNLKIAYGMKRSGVTGVGDISGEESIGAQARWMVNSAPAEMRDQVIMIFIKAQREKLNRHNVPWFLPESFGGLGIPRPNNEFGLRSLKSDLRFAAAWKATAPKLPHYSSRVGWKTWEYVMKRLKPLQPAPQLAQQGAGNLSIDALAGMLTREAVLRRGVEVYTKSTQQRQKKDKDDYTKYLRKIEKICSTVRKNMGSVQPFSSEPTLDETVHSLPYALVRMIPTAPTRPSLHRRLDPTTGKPIVIEDNESLDISIEVAA